MGDNHSETENFEKAFENLQQAVKKLESGTLSLEESLNAYEMGVKWSGVCQKHLESAEKKIRALAQNPAASSSEEATL